MSGGHRLRAVASWVPALVVVPLAMAGAVVVSQPDEENPELRELHPLDRGTTWVYAVFDHGQPSGTRTKHIAGRAGLIDNTGLRDAVQLVSRYTDQPRVGPSSTMSYVGFDGPRMLQFGLVSDGTSATLDPPAPAYELPVEEGTSWSYDGTLGTAKLSFEATLEEITDIEVSGRTFRDCAYYVNDYQVEFDDGTSGDPERLEEWTCPGFGTVRTVSTIEAQDSLVTEELIEFHGVEDDWRSAEATDATASTSQVAGSTVSFDEARSNAIPDGELGDELAWSDARDTQFRFPPAADDEIRVIADNAGDVAATDVVTGELRWRLNVPGPVVAPPVIVGDTVFVAAADKTLLAVSAADGSSRWLHRFDDQVSAAPTPLGDSVLVPTDDGSITTLSLADGTTHWTAELTAPVREAPAVDDDRWLVADRSGSVTAYTEEGEELWSRELEEALAVGPAAADGLVLVADQAGVVYAIDSDDGSLTWQRRMRGYPSLPLSVANDTVVAVLGDDRVQALDLATGESRWHHEDDELYAPAVIVGHDVVTVSDSGLVRLRDLHDGEVVDSWELPQVAPDAWMSADLAPALVGDALVVGGSVTAEGYTAALFAYPVSDSPDGAAGVFFGNETRVLGVVPSDELSVSGDTIWVPGADAGLYRSDGGEPEKLHAGEALQPGVAVGEGLVVAQHDDRYVAYPVDGGEPLWEIPALAPILGVRPAIADDTVFLPESDVGLVATGLDGMLRWTKVLRGAFFPTSPLALPDGDVVYGGNGLARYDGATGDEVWRVRGALLPGTPAYADGVVYADVSSDLQASGLGAFDAETGERLWLAANDNQLFGGRPAVSDGVVVDADAAGRVFAVDAADGSPLWELRLSSVPAGNPLIVDGRVYLYELGRNEDLFQRGVRLTAHDLRTGRFLGAFEPATSTFGDRPVATATADGRIVIPTGEDFGSLQILEPRP